MSATDRQDLCLSVITIVGIPLETFIVPAMMVTLLLRINTLVLVRILIEIVRKKFLGSENYSF